MEKWGEATFKRTGKNYLEASLRGINAFQKSLAKASLY